MNRKTFLYLSALSSAGLLLPFASHSKRRFTFPPQKGKVIVVGAGMSGVAAANYLQASGIEVLVLEATNRIGGRVFTDRDSGTALDMGAGWIEGKIGNPLAKIAREHNIETVISEYGNSYNYDANGRLDDEKLDTLYQKTTQIFNEMYVEGNDTKDNDISVQMALDNISRPYHLTKEEKQVFEWHCSTVEMDYACKLSDFSLYHQRTGDGFYGNDLILPDGYDQIPRVLSNDIKIQYQAYITEISEKEKSVQLRDATGQTYECDYVILTVPLGVLKQEKIKFTKPLPEWKNKAIQDMGMGNLYKIAMKFDEAFWEKDRDTIAYLSETKGEFPITLNWMYYTGEPCLIAALGGDFVNKMKDQSDEEIGHYAAGIYSKMFQKPIPDPSYIKVARWGEMETAFGAYSYTPVGVRGNATSDALAEKVGRIYFAGEATNKTYPATVHGAYYSGVREAEKIVNLLR